MKRIVFILMVAATLQGCASHATPRTQVAQSVTEDGFTPEDRELTKLTVISNTLHHQISEHQQRQKNIEQMEKEISMMTQQNEMK